MIVVLTYNVPHKKTQDLLFQLRLKTEEEVCVIGMPYKYQKKHKPLILHRPSKHIEIPNQKLCQKLGYRYIEIEPSLLLNKLYDLDPSLVIIGGVGILDKKVVQDFMVVNCHPGIIPDVRGLDALKWAIYLDKEIGVTLHIVDEEPDSGYMIKQQLIPIYPEDTFHSIAYRQYEYEIDLLSDSVRLLKGIKSKDELCKIDVSDTKVYKRMDLEKERELYKNLEMRLKTL